MHGKSSGYYFHRHKTGNWRTTCDPSESPVQSVAAGRQAALARGAAKRRGRPAPNAHRHHAVDAQRKTRSSSKSTCAPPAPLGPTQRGESSSCSNRTICGNKANGSESEGNRFPTAHLGMLKTISNSKVHVRFSALNSKPSLFARTVGEQTSTGPMKPGAAPSTDASEALAADVNPGQKHSF